ncbi:MAG: hypothetical protein JSS37_00750 [Proteobacteria bacterium]|nr:hypothetical protein [Pseudomonadota bacterium]
MTLSSKTLIDTLFEEQKGLAKFLRDQGQISYAQDIEGSLSKILLLSSASYFENRITNAISDFAERISKSNEALVSLVKNKAIERQYHTYFQWREKSRSSNSFFAMFGTSFRDSAKNYLRTTPNISEAEKAFLELGDLRNLLVHGNFANYPLEKTADEIYELYKKALQFVEYIESKLSSEVNG